MTYTEVLYVRIPLLQLGNFTLFATTCILLPHFFYVAMNTKYPNPSLRNMRSALLCDALTTDILRGRFTSLSEMR